MERIIDFASNPAILPWFILCAVVIFERFWYLPARLDPFTFVRLLALRMAQRVCPSASETRGARGAGGASGERGASGTKGPNDASSVRWSSNTKPSTNSHISTNSQNNTLPKSQFWISGALAAFMIIVPNVLILIIFREFIYYPELFDAIILYFCIQFSANIQRFQRIRRALIAGKKKLAKEMLAPMVLRETAMLSDVGVSKAAIESILLRFHYQTLTVCFLFILLGPFTALSYRLCYELHIVWNTKIEAYHEFGKPMAKLVMLFQWLPVRLNALLSVILSRGFSVFKYVKTSKLTTRWNEPHGAILLRANHYALDINLSGAVFYASADGAEKVRRTKYIGKGEPTAQFMPNALAVINRVLLVNLLLLLLTCLIISTLGMQL